MCVYALVQGFFGVQRMYNCHHQTFRHPSPLINPLPPLKKKMLGSVQKDWFPQSGDKPQGLSVWKGRKVEGCKLFKMCDKMAETLVKEDSPCIRRRELGWPKGLNSSLSPSLLSSLLPLSLSPSHSFIHPSFILAFRSS